MTEPRVLLGKEAGTGAAAPVVASSTHWKVLGGAGWLFLLIGGVDAGLTWVPLGFGSPDWEFGTITASLNGLPVPLLGAVLVLASAVARQQWLLAKGIAVALIALAIVLLGLAVIYLTNVPIGLRSVTEPVARLGLKKAIVKSAVQLAAYPAGLTWLALMVWKRARKST